jgi:hypothetical protein
MNNLDPKVQELIKTVKRLISEIETQTSRQQNKSSIDPFAFDVVDMVDHSGQKHSDFPEPIIKMEDEF